MTLSSDVATPGASTGGRRARASVFLAAALGTLLALGLISWFGIGVVLGALARIGWGGFALFVFVSLFIYPLTGGAWGVLARKLDLRTMMVFIWSRFVREGASDLLPFSSLGGVLIGARNITLWGVGSDSAYGSLAVDLMTEIAAQIVYMLLGLALLSIHLAHVASSGVFLACFAGAFVLALALIGALLFGQSRGLDLFSKVLQRIAPDTVQHMQGVREWIAELNGRPGRLASSVALHLAGWIASGALSWLGLDLMGVKLSLGAVMAIESLLSAVKSAAFVAPSGLGVQEGAYALLGHIFGLTPGVSIALSLLKRARDLVLGAPALLVWQAMEARRALKPLQA